MNILKKLATVFGIIVAIWLLVPIPELSIIATLLGGKTIDSYFGVPTWTSYVVAAIGAVIGWIIIRHYNIDDQLLSFLKAESL